MNSVPNEMKQRIHAINIQKTYFVMAYYTENLSIANTIQKFHIQSNFHTGYKHNFYHGKQEKFDELFDQYHIPLLKDMYHPELVQ